MSQLSQREHAAIDLAYEAALQPALWPQALRAIAECFDSEGTALVFERDRTNFAAIVSPGLEAFGQAYNEYWGKSDQRGARVRQLLYEQGLESVTDRHICTPQEIETDPWYTEVAIPHGCGWFMAASVSPLSDVMVAISVQRAMRKGAFTDGELDHIIPIARHVERALRITTRLMTDELVRLSLGDALERLDCGVLLLDDQVRVTYSNAMADRLMGDVFNFSSGRLAARTDNDNAQLMTAIRRATDANPTTERPLLFRGTNTQSLRVVYVLPVRGTFREADFAFMSNSHCMVLVVEPGTNAAPDPSIVRDVLGLTLGEARVAALIGTGRSPAETAETLGISVSTTRNVLKRIFSKLGVSRQSELAVMLGRFVLSSPRGS